MFPVAALAVSFLLAAPAMAEAGLSYSQLRLPELPAAQGLPLQAFAYPGDGWSDEQVQACARGAMPAGVPLRYAALVLRGDGVWLEGERVLALEAGALPAGETNAAETALRGALGDLFG